MDFYECIDGRMFSFYHLKIINQAKPDTLDLWKQAAVVPEQLHLKRLRRLKPERQVSITSQAVTIDPVRWWWGGEGGL